MRIIRFFTFFVIFFFYSQHIKAQSEILPEQDFSYQRKYRYEYQDRDHSFNESLTHVSILYALGWAGYFLTQGNTIKSKSSWGQYKENFGKLVFDKDEPIWNWVGHPLTGSQVFLFYRGLGYSHQKAFFFSFIQSTLFEFTTEIFTEPASIQDLYQTPVFGSVLGFFLERLSLNLLNTDNFFANLLGHIINPTSLFWFYEGKIELVPTINPSTKGLTLRMDF
jgi:hypothetical protein